jgi:hypothetical protein
MTEPEKITHIFARKEINLRRKRWTEHLNIIPEERLSR